jgi:hypothetical protein
MSTGPSWPSAVVAVAFIALVSFMFYEAVNSSTDFSTIWAAVGSVVGVVVGAIPSYFFAQQAQKSDKRAQILAGAVDPDKFNALVQSKAFNS